MIIRKSFWLHGWLWLALFFDTGVWYNLIISFKHFIKKSTGTQKTCRPPLSLVNIRWEINKFESQPLPAQPRAEQSVFKYRHSFYTLMYNGLTSRYVVSFSSKQYWLHFPILVAKVKISFTNIFHHNLIIKYWNKHIQQDRVYSHFVLLKNI